MQSILIRKKFKTTFDQKKNMEFNLKGQEYIELMKLLKFMGLTDTGGESKIRIDNGEVKINGEVDLRRRRKCRDGDKIEFDGHTIEITNKKEEEH